MPRGVVGFGGAEDAPVEILTVAGCQGLTLEELERPPPVRSAFGAQEERGVATVAVPAVSQLEHVGDDAHSDPAQLGPLGRVAPTIRTGPAGGGCQRSRQLLYSCQAMELASGNPP